MIHGQGGSGGTSANFPSAFRPSLETPSTGSEPQKEKTVKSGKFPNFDDDASYDEQLSKTGTQNEFSELKSPMHQIETSSSEKPGPSDVQKPSLGGEKSSIHQSEGQKPSLGVIGTPKPSLDRSEPQKPSLGTIRTPKPSFEKSEGQKPSLGTIQTEKSKSQIPTLAKTGTKAPGTSNAISNGVLSRPPLSKSVSRQSSRSDSRPESAHTPSRGSQKFTDKRRNTVGGKDIPGVPPDQVRLRRLESLTRRGIGESGVVRTPNRSVSIVSSHLSGPVNYGNVPPQIRQRPSIVHSRGTYHSQASTKRSSIVSSTRDGALPVLDLSKGLYQSQRASGPRSSRGGSASQRGGSRPSGTQRPNTNNGSKLPTAHSSIDKGGSDQFVGITGRASPSTFKSNHSPESEALSYIDREELYDSQEGSGSQDEQIAIQSSKSSVAMSQGEARAAARATSIKRESMPTEIQKSPSLFSNERISEDITPYRFQRSSLASSAAPYTPRGSTIRQQSQPSPRTAGGSQPSPRVSGASQTHPRFSGMSQQGRVPQSRGSTGIVNSQGVRTPRKSDDCVEVTDHARKSLESIVHTANIALDELISFRQAENYRRSEEFRRSMHKEQRIQQENRGRSMPDRSMQEQQMDSERTENYNAQANFDLSGIVDLKFDMNVTEEEKRLILERLNGGKTAETNVHLRVQPELDLILSDVFEEKTETGASSLRCSMSGEISVDLSGVLSTDRSLTKNISARKTAGDHITEEPDDQSQFGQTHVSKSTPGAHQGLNVNIEDEGSHTTDVSKSEDVDTNAKKGTLAVDQQSPRNTSNVKSENQGLAVMPAKPSGVSENTHDSVAEKEITQLNYEHNVPEMEHDSYLGDENRIELDSENRKLSVRTKKGSPNPTSQSQSDIDDGEDNLLGSRTHVDSKTRQSFDDLESPSIRMISKDGKAMEVEPDTLIRTSQKINDAHKIPSESFPNLSHSEATEIVDEAQHAIDEHE